MKTPSKILTLCTGIVLIFWMFGLSDRSWSATKSVHPGQMSVPADDQNVLSDKAAHPKNDSVSTILCDKNPPYFTHLDPASEQPEVPRQVIIKFRVNDDYRPKKNEWDRYGVDTTQIFISIKSRFWEVDSVRPHKITLADSIFKVDCEYEPPKQFDWSDTITVTLFARDVSYLKNSAETTYVFYAVKDSVGPMIMPTDPDSGQANVSVQTAIEFKVWDSDAGVDLTSVYLDITSKTVTVNRATPETTKADGDTVYFRYKPDQSFAYDDEVMVHIHAVDRAARPNASDLFYKFNTESAPSQDTTGPVIKPYDPYPDQTNVAIDAAMHFWVWDSSGVDVDSVYLDITSKSVTVSRATPETTKADGDTVYFQYKPDQSFAYDDEVTVHIHAVDRAARPNASDLFYKFNTESAPSQDTTGPEIIPDYPLPNATGVPVDIKITFAVRDIGSGVDASSISIEVTSNAKGQVVGELRKFQVQSDSVYCEFIPGSLFAYNDIHTVFIRAADRRQNVSEMSYWFVTESQIDLTIKFDKLKKQKIKAGETLELSATATALFGNCDTPFYVCFYINDFDHQIECIKDIQFEKDKSSCVVNEDISIAVEGKYMLFVYVDANPFPSGVIKESNEWNNSDSLEIIVEPELIVRPNPFTPNDDGFNDEAEFNFSPFRVDKPILRIFDVHGREMAKLDKPSDDKRFIWNGRDGNGKPLLPGMYLYIFCDQDKIQARGCIVIVR